MLIVRVHPEILHGQRLPDEVLDEETIWQNRYRSIVDLENHLYRNGTRIIKFFLHLSKEEQRKRFLRRIDEPEKNWKFSIADVEERQFWDAYMQAYEACLSATSTEQAPWYIVPANDKKCEIDYFKRHSRHHAKPGHALSSADHFAPAGITGYS